MIGAALLALLGHAVTSFAPQLSPQGPAPRTLTISHEPGSKAVVGAAVVAHAAGLPPGRTVDIAWGTVQGGWVVEGYAHFKGKKFTETTRPLGQVTIGADGGLTFPFTIPEDYGGVHEISVLDKGVLLAQGGIEVTQTFEMRPTEGPVGTPIELRVTGLGWRTLESTWVVNWDNREVGWVSATDTLGTAVARFRASGPAGPHAIKVYTGYMGQGYLNHEQAPNAHLPRPDFTFRVTSARATVAPAYAEPYQKQPVPPSAATGGVSATLTPTQGPVLTRAHLRATGLPGNARVLLVWGTQAGSRVTSTGFASMDTQLSTLVVGADGAVNVPVTIPDDLGGLHTLSIVSAGTALARVSFTIETSIVGMSPVSGPVGTPVTIHLKGVGWTDYDNIYVANYDNAYMGYACGFNSQGDVVINFVATGEPGLHLIDLYPGIYQGPEGGQHLYRLPQLTYATDHPGNKIPALRFAFEVTPAR